MVDDIKSHLKRIIGSMSRKSASFALTENPDSPNDGSGILWAGSFQAVKSKEGFLVSMKLEPDQIRRLRDECNRILGDS